jgi:glucose/arabinose dehydrogenase/mono/diheme cytochrome c family protein
VVAAALYLFFLTPINFSPELLLDSFLIAFLLMLLAFLLVRRRAGEGVGASLGAFLRNLFGLLLSPWIWPILLFALSPIVVAYMFTTDRDFANWVTNLRVSSNVDDDLPYAVVNALGETRFETPIMAQFADRDPRTLFVLERGGRLWRVDYPSGANKTLLLDLRQGVGYVEMENGALGFDLHPEFGPGGSPNAGFVYVYFTEYRESGQTNRLNRYDLSLPDVAARTASALPLIAQTRDNDGYHNGGSVEFGPDGFLYLAVGEASMEECHQRVDCGLVGGIMRIDVDRRGGAVSRPIQRQPRAGRTANYFIPLDNPYAGDPNLLGEYWAHGLRNPFRISFDPAGGALWAGDVGSTEWEEVNRIERGGNYQFPFVEGRTQQPASPPPPQVVGRQHGPVLAYAHTAFLRSIIGGVVHRGRIEAARGRYAFMDNYSGQVMVIPADAPRSEGYTVIARSRDVAQRGPTGLLNAPDGELLVIVMGDNDRPTGIDGKLVPAGSESARAEEQRAAREAPAPGGISEAQARSLFGTNCARCHGAQGEGDGPDARLLTVRAPDFTSAAFKARSDEERIYRAIRGGGPAVGRSELMPPWEGVLSEAEMRALAGHVRRMERR